jgi:hydroxyacylglutathione hydrolase
MHGGTVGAMRLRQFVVDGLGHLSTIIADDVTRIAAVVDPRRDVDVYLEAARDAELRIAHVVETHLHNDYVSGARELAALTGATHAIGAGAELGYEHRPLRDGDTFEVGSLRFTTLETPGHTPEHVAYAVADTTRADDPALLFTGGSLLVGAVGRTDLLGQENAVPYARAMFRSLRDVILRHDDFVGVYPTHGAGSLCSTGIASTPSSTIGYERRHNPMVRPSEVELFVSTLLRPQPAFPRYFDRMRPTNQAGPPLIGAGVPEPRPLSLDEARAAVAGGALVVDARASAEHAIAHLPDSLSIPAGASFGTWLGWVVEPDQPIVLVLAHAADWDDLARQAMRIGYEGSLVGHVAGGVRRWAEAGLPLESSGRISIDQLATSVAAGGPDSPLVLDVRQAGEYAHAHVPGSLHLTAGTLPERLADLPRDRPIAVICASGYRSSVAASLLRRAGFDQVSWVANGVPVWQAQGYPVERGEGADDALPDAARPRGAEEPLVAHRH